MNFITIQHLNQAISGNLHKIPLDVDLVVGIPRSGMLAASILALHRNLPFTDLESFLEGRFYAKGKTRKHPNWLQSLSDAQHILIVDDSISTGQAMRETRAKVDALKLDARVSYCAILALPTNFMSVDIYLEIVNHPRLFEWHYMHHWGLNHCCVDIDGVLCEDPGFFENDDGARYQRFVENATPRLLPTNRIAYLVTSRLEKYRQGTEDWLQRHNVSYDHLVMLDGVTAKERRKGGGHAAFKAEVYKGTNCYLFIESSYEQAVEICERSKKPVFSVQNSTYIQPKELTAHLKNLANDWRIAAKRVVRKLLP